MVGSGVAAMVSPSSWTGWGAALAEAGTAAVAARAHSIAARTQVRERMVLSLCGLTPDRFARGTPAKT
jgi:hypothetical protein